MSYQFWANLLPYGMVKNPTIESWLASFAALTR